MAIRDFIQKKKEQFVDALNKPGPQWAPKIPKVEETLLPKLADAPEFDFSQKIQNRLGRFGAQIAEGTLNIPSKIVQNYGKTAMDIQGWDGKSFNPRKLIQFAGRTGENALDIASLGKGKMALESGSKFLQGTKPLGTLMKEGWKQGTKTGTRYGLGYGVSTGVQDENATPVSVAQNTAVSGVAGRYLGGALGGGLPAVGALPGAVKNSLKNIANKPKVTDSIPAHYVPSRSKFPVGQVPAGYRATGRTQDAGFNTREAFTEKLIPGQQKMNRAVPTLRDWATGVREALPRPGMSIQDVSKRTPIQKNLSSALSSGSDESIFFGSLSKEKFNAVNAIRVSQGKPPIESSDIYFHPNVIDKLRKKRIALEGMTPQQVSDVAFSALHNTRNRVSSTEYPQVQKMLTVKGDKANQAFIGDHSGGVSAKSVYPTSTKRVNKNTSDGPTFPSSNFSENTDTLRQAAGLSDLRGVSRSGGAANPHLSQVNGSASEPRPLNGLSGVGTFDTSVARTGGKVNNERGIDADDFKASFSTPNQPRSKSEKARELSGYTQESSFSPRAAALPGQEPTMPSAGGHTPRILAGKTTRQVGEPNRGMPRADVPYIADATPNQGKVNGRNPESRFAERVSDKLGKENPVGYTQSVNNDILKKAKANLAIGRDFALKQARNKNLGPEANATAMELVDDAIKGEKWEILDDLLKEFSPRFTKEGQNIQILSRWGRMTPTGAIRYTQHLIDKAREITGKSITFTPQAKSEIAELAKNVMATKEGTRERAIASALLMKKMAEQVPTGLGKKMSTIQTMAQLLNPKTAIRNIGGNTLFAAGEVVSDVVGTPIDMMTSLFTGKRTKTLPSLPTLARGFVKGGKEAMEEVDLGIDTKGLPTQFELGSTPTFRGKNQNWEKALGYELRVPDRAFYQAAYDDSLRQQMKLAGVSTPTKEMGETAHFDGLYRTFQDESLASQLFVKIKRGLNFGKDFGAGDLVLKYPKTPGNLLARALDYSPAGYLKAVLELAKPAVGKQFDQKAFVEAISRGSVGGVGLFGLGYMLNEMGIVSGRPDSDKDINAVERSQGGGGYRFNVSALKRLVFGGFEPEKATPREGDKMMTYDWIQPFAVPFSMGANVSETGKFSKTGQVALESLESGVNTLMEQPLVSGLKKLVGYGDFIGGAGETMKGAAASFVPTFLNQIKQFTDNTSRETRGGGLMNEGMNLIKNKVPGVAGTLPSKYTVWGEPMETYQNGGNSLFNVFFNPSFTSTLESTPAGKEVMDIYERSGEKQQAPRTVSKSVTINGESRDLNGEEISQYQKYIGEKTSAIFDKLVQDQGFQSLSDEEKAKKMAGILTDINTAAKVELFGHNARLDKQTKSILGGEWSEDAPSKKNDSGDDSQKKSGRKKTTWYRGRRNQKTTVSAKKSLRSYSAPAETASFIINKMTSRLRPLRAFGRSRTNLASVRRPNIRRPKKLA